jgi:hypothetical protein
MKEKKPVAKLHPKEKFLGLKVVRKKNSKKSILSKPKKNKL